MPNEALSAHDLQYMRDAATLLMPDLCTIERLTETPNAFGGVARTWATQASSVRCRLDQVRGGPIVAANWMVTLPWDQVITFEDRIVANGLTLEPVEMNTGRSWEAATRVWCKRAA